MLLLTVYFKVDVVVRPDMRKKEKKQQKLKSSNKNKLTLAFHENNGYHQLPFMPDFKLSPYDEKDGAILVKLY